jgi:hypothetical protein
MPLKRQHQGNGRELSEQVVCRHDCTIASANIIIQRCGGRQRDDAGNDDSDSPQNEQCGANANGALEFGNLLLPQGKTHSSAFDLPQRGAAVQQQ